ncbi:Tat pathway signal sequence domain protein [Streptomyces griseosporeus]|uniref:Tat pathway signal sequence domain protein n=1 Tax=Streptomyces griseosporeus TaxID=1910 RepID=UPI0036BC95B8
MSGVGPVEPGDGTRAWDGRFRDSRAWDGRPQDETWDSHPPDDSLLAELPRRPGPLRLLPRSRPLRLALAALLLLAGAGYLYTTRPRPPGPAPVPYPIQVVALTYPADQPAPRPAGSHAFRFSVLVSVRSGPPVSVTRVSQPYAGLTVTASPPPPFRTKAGSPRKITITMHVTECGKVPRNAGFPFLDVTLRNPQAIQDHSFILGERYARDLSEALQVACSNENGHHQNR